LIYAFVPPASTQGPSTIATIDPRARSVAFSAPVSFVPWQMAVSPDGTFLYVASILPRKLIRLRLPDLTPDLEVDLGKPTWIPSFLPDYDVTMFPGSVSVDPSDSRRFAVSMLSSTYPSIQGLRVYQDTTPIAEIHWDVNARFGDIVTFETPDSLTTARSSTDPDAVTRLRIQGVDIVELDSLRVGSLQEGGGSASLSKSANAYLTGGGSKVELPAYTYRGQLPPLTLLNQGDPAPLLKGCVFANDDGNVAACLSHWDSDVRLPTFRVFVLYELTNAMPFMAVGLDQNMSPASEIVRYGPGEFAVSVGMDALERSVQLEPFSYLVQNKRIYFLSGIDTVFRP